jgi:hypothetical protein
MSTHNRFAELQLQLDNAREEIEKAMEDQESVDEGLRIQALIRIALMDIIDRSEACVRLIDGTDTIEEATHDSMRLVLRRIVEEDKIPVAEIAHDMGLSTNTIYNFIGDKTGTRLPKSMEKIEKYLRDNGYDI